MRALALALIATVALATVPAAAQDIASPILVIDQERLFAESAFGARVIEEIERRSTELAAENREIEAALIAEEQDLTERRAELPSDEFRALADAFDAKVQQLRAQQDEKGRELARLRDAERQRFVAQIVPVLSEVVRERGAVVILDRRDVFLSAEAIDITEAAIARIDEAIGAGSPAEPE